MKRKIAERRVLWPDSPTGRPRHKLFAEEIKNKFKGLSSLITQFNTGMGTREVSSILGSDAFPFPKPSGLVSYLLEQSTDENSIILDSFSGSGTTGHAVLAANNRDGGNRRFILVEMEDYADKLTAERIRRVIKGYKFKGTQKTELLRENLNWRAIERADDLIQRVKGIENLEGPDFDRITKQVKDGELIVTGEKAVTERTEGLGGEFTYCTLGEPVELDKVLSGESLPPYMAIGAALFHMATNQALDPKAIRQKEFYLGETESQHVWLIYKSDLDWLKTPDAALTLARAKAFAEAKPGKRHLVFAPARFVSQKMLAEQNIPVEFVPLPFALYRIERN
jgi:adenine-specific DNA-methyltransferase